MKVERTTMNRSPVLLSDIGALKLKNIIKSYLDSLYVELGSTEKDTHAYVFLEDEIETAKSFTQILEEAFPFLGELPK